MLEFAHTVSTDDKIANLTAAIKAATEKNQWSIVRDLSRMLNRVLREQYRYMPMPDEQRQAIGRSNAITRSNQAAEEERPGAELLRLIAKDPRYGSLRVFCEVEQIGRSSMSAYLSGKTRCPAYIDALVRRRFPTAVIEWPAGIAD